MPMESKSGRFGAHCAVAMLLAGVALTAGAQGPTPIPQDAAPVAPPAAAGPAAPATCPEGRIADIEPQEAIIGRFEGRKARIFVESCLESGPTGRTPEFDTVLILSGPEVMGGTVGILAQGECTVGHKFLGLVEFLHAGAMAKLYEHHPALQDVEHLDLAALTPLAEAGEPRAAFHLGFVKTMGWGAERDRPGSIVWFRRAAEAGYEPGMLALGMALAGPGVVEEWVLAVGEQRPRDAETDLVQACYWLRQLAAPEHGLADVAQGLYEREVAPRLTRKEKKACDALLKKRDGLHP